MGAVRGDPPGQVSGTRPGRRPGRCWADLQGKKRAGRASDTPGGGAGAFCQPGKGALAAIPSVIRGCWLALTVSAGVDNCRAAGWIGLQSGPRPAPTAPAQRRHLYSHGAVDNLLITGGFDPVSPRFGPRQGSRRGVLRYNGGPTSSCHTFFVGRRVTPFDVPFFYEPHP